ncbi:MAG TPA: GvpL/GvpF family gas vesicle protein [Trebonia sp.]
MSTDTGVWTYAITGHDRLDGPDGEVDLSWLSGVAEAPVRTIDCAGLAVLASDVSLAEFGEQALHENMENLDWLDEVARLHHYVVDAAARLFPLLPVRLATVYRDDGAVCAAITGHRDQLLDTLGRIGGRVEWGVKAYAAPDADGDGDAGTAEHPRAAREPAGAGSGPGLAYLRRRRDKLAAGRESRAAAVHGARTVHADLAGQATQAVVRPPQSVQLSGARQPMLLNAAYLLEASEGPSFTAAVAAEATAHPELQIELTGPWPPYSFAGDDAR